MMYTPDRTEQRQMLIAMVAESLVLADLLDLNLVGISLNTALVHLTGEGLATEAGDALIH